MTTDTKPDDRQGDALAVIASLGPAPDSAWRHRSGGIYRVVCCALREADLTPVVVYRGDGGPAWVRPLNEFRERFALAACAPEAHRCPPV